MSKSSDGKPLASTPPQKAADDQSVAKPLATQEAKKTGKRLPTDHSYMKYSGLAFQMVAAILFGLFLGRYLDTWLQIEPALTVVGCLLGVFAGLYIALKDFL